MARHRDSFLAILESVAALPVGSVAVGLPSNDMKGNNNHQKAKVI